MTDTTHPRRDATTAVHRRRRTASLVETLYDELRQLARARMSRLGPGQTLEPTALVHEAFERLSRSQNTSWNSKGHFFGAAARAMRNILVESARQKGSLKRGGNHVRVDLLLTLPDSQHTVTPAGLLTLHDALEALQSEFPRRAEVVMLHYFAGLTMNEIADVLEVSEVTVRRYMRFARAWLAARARGP